MSAPAAFREARGTFEVVMTPQPFDTSHGDAGPGRVLLDKTFDGDFVGTGHGQMLSMRSDQPGSAGYVAMERVSGKLHGRAGSFALQHSGSMTRGDATLQIGIVPDSGSAALLGIEGTMSLDFSQSKHHWTLVYRLPEPAAG